MRPQDKVTYLNRPAYITGITYNYWGRTYDLARKPGTPYPNYRNVPEKDIREPFVAVSTGGSCQIISFTDRDIAQQNAHAAQSVMEGV